MRARILPGLVLFTALALTACTLLNPLKSRQKAALDEFIYALRWQRYAVAAAAFAEAPRRSFLDQVENLHKDLSIIDVRLLRVEFSEEGRRAEVRLEMDYFLLPSATIRTLRIDQTWVHFESSEQGRKGFLITTPFPEIPGESQPGKSTLPP